MSETALREIQNQIPEECSTQISCRVFQADHTSPSQDPFLTCFTNPLSEEEDLPEESAIPVAPLVVDPDLELKVRRACERISENVHICANEPSLAFFRLSEHVRKALPPTVESRQQVHTIQRQLGAAYEDADVALQEVQSMEQATPMLNSTMEMLRTAISLQQQVKQEQSKRSGIACSRERQSRRPSFNLAKLIS